MSQDKISIQYLHGIRGLLKLLKCALKLTHLNICEGPRPCNKPYMTCVNPTNSTGFRSYSRPFREGFGVGTMREHFA